MPKRKFYLPKWALWLLFSIALSSVALFLTNYPSYKMTDEDEIEAVQLVVAWIAEHKPLPGVKEEYPDWEIMEDIDVVVICDFLPPGLDVSQNSRIQRVTQDDYQTYMNDKYRSADYLKIELKEDSYRKKVFEVSNIFGPQGGHGYNIEFQKKLYGLRADIEFLWIM
jgi:hypothetical protein